MAKTQIKNYVFKPGIGANDNRYANAYNLIKSNKSFIQKETSAYIIDKISNAAQYTPTNAAYEPTTGVMEITIGTHNFNVGDALLIAQEGITLTCALDGDATTHAYPRITDPAYQKALVITAVTATSVTVNVGTSSDTSVHTFDSATANAISDVFFNYVNDSEAKCERDIGYVVDAYLKDLRYGGNETLKNVIKYYWDQTVAQVDGDRGAEIAAHNFIGRLIKDYVLTKTAYSALNTQVAQIVTGDDSETDVQFTPTDATYTPATGDMTLTVGAHNLAVGDEIHIAPGGITFTCALDGNTTDHPYPRANGVPNDTGKDPYYYAPITISSVTDTTITVNVGISSDTSVHTFASATANSVTSGPTTKINTLVFNTVDVISNGLNGLPKLVPTGVGTVKIQGRYSTDELLLITNTTENVIIYNFSNNSLGGAVTLKIDGIEEDVDFAKYLQTTDAITTITLNYNTSAHSSTDELQIFVEKTENGKSVITTRPFDFGTDAIERTRNAAPVSMLDADFEYGLQPTKWAAIGTLRGYPSVYEIPGSDTSVLSVTTDASAGTEGIGQSLITVTTVTPHGFIAGDPITIKALEDSISGASRSEGSFVIETVPTPSTFTYYAKAKVGTANGQVLSTTYTQLRKAGFYTGASIGQTPEVEVISNGFSGTLVAELDVTTGSTVIPFDGVSPGIGAPLVNANITTGSQVTSVIDSSAGGGVYITPTLSGDVSAGQNTATVVDATGIVENLAVDNGAGTAIYVTDITGNTLTFNDDFVSSLTGNSAVYTGVTGNNNTATGAGAEFNIANTAGTYAISSIAVAGTGYQVGDRIAVSADQLGGVSPDNDLIIIVDSIDGLGGITSTSFEGSGLVGDEVFTGLSGTNVGSLGINALFDITYVNNSYTASVTSPDNSTGYAVGDIIVIAGDLIDPVAGTTPANDLYLTVDSIGAGGAVVSVTETGTAPDANRTFFNPSYTTGGSGSGAQFTITTDGETYSVEVQSGFEGINFLPTDTVTVVGTELGGSTPANDATITIDNVGGTGNITAVSIAGTAYNGNQAPSVPGTTRSGSGATFDITLNAGVFEVAINAAGTNYGVDQEILIQAGSTTFGGEVVTNDLTITVTGVDGLVNGAITSVSAAGTAPSGTGSFINVVGTNQPIQGTSATFNVTRLFEVYSNISVNAAGSSYAVGNTLVIPGAQVGGNSNNDITVRVTGVDGAGAITAINTEYVAAEYGTVFDMISTFSMSEVTTGTITKLDEIVYSALSTLEVTFDSAHGLVPGDTFITTISSDDGVNNHSLAGGSFFATEIPAVNKLKYQARTAGFIDTDGGADSILATVYPRPDSFFIHRPYDGGVQLGTGGPQHGAQAIRQSKKYIRYQSGKGIMYTTGALFAPSYDLRSLTAEGVEVGDLITVVTDDNDHGVQVGGVIRILGVETPGYNSGPETATPPNFDYEVVSVVDERTFKIRAQRRLGATDAVLGFGSQMSVVSWHGATVRSGIFDDQNGIFWEYDGTNISVNQRTGTRQLAGTIAIAVDTNLITGTNTRFQDQLKAGDRIIIKGMTHVVSHVNSQTEITVTPDWRGVVDIAGAKANLIVDKKVKQENFNLDRLDGTGPSGYNIDTAKMQMIGIQYSWYGAGFIDFMLRGADGNFVFCHRMRNSNVNTEAFMRSGNLPVRYEVTNEGPSGKLASAMDDSQTTIPLVDSSFFPDTGTVYINNEIINFDGNNKTSNTLTGCTRAATYTNFQAGANRSYTAGSASAHVNRSGVVLISQTVTPLISHWGSAFITDGGFDEDRGYIFSYAETGVTVSTTKQTAFMIRLAPSVSDALVGDLGERELLNRAQLLLQGLEVTSDGTDGTDAILGGIVVEGVLNPQNYPLNPGDVGWSGLSGVAQGGQPSFAQIASGGSVVWSTGDTPVTTTATAQSSITETLDSGTQNWGRNTYININSSNYRTVFGSNDTSIVIGKTITGAAVPSNTTIIDARVDASGTYGWFRLSNRTTDNITPNSSDYYTILEGGDLINRNFALLSKASFDASAASVGTQVTSGGNVSFPANTLINDIKLKEFAGTEYYEVQFNNSFSGTLTQGTGEVEFTFVQPPYAQPGETVFSFIAVPGERSTLDLSELKELTNTPLGGRGTYPNGPDVLAINIYKVSGAELNSNIILKWGEAQA